ncbi:MAG: transcription termination/antitermination protein NusG [Alphaproteobacteria bacterium]|nr:MAG: transcription termination/antitermination protein NusG [Alphaproteobacteria bacterium]
MSETPAAKAASPRASGPRWYVIHAYSGFEKKVAAEIRKQAETKALNDMIVEVVVPSEEVVEIRRGAKIKSERKFYPGYVLVKMELTDETWNLVRNVPRVSGFLGGGNRPSPISEAEAQRILNQMEEGVSNPRPSVTFEIGEQVRVCDGPFASFNGTVEEVDESKSRLKVSVSIFGRSTPVDLEYGQVEKV